MRTPYRTPAGPDTYALVLSAGAGQPGVPAGTQVVLSATVSDTRYSSANGTEPSQSVAAAEARLDAPPWEAGAPIAMEAVDGGFNTKTEGVRTTIDTTGLSAGRHSLYVRGRDADGNWGAVSAVFFYISDGSGNLAPQADFTNTIDGRTVAFADTSTDADGSIVSWTWDFGDGENANQQNPSHTYAADGTYRVILTVTDDGGLADTVNQTIVIGQPLVYCDASGNSQRYEWIARVAAGDLDHASDASGYSDFTGMTANLSAGDTAAVSLVPGFAGSTYTEYWKVWIDYNRDGDFDDPGEAVFSGSGRSTVTGSFTVPSATAYGNARMRVAMKYNGAPAACGGFSYGEVEDYTVRIE